MILILIVLTDICALRASAMLDVFDAENFLIADVNKDKKITAADARIVLRVAAKLQTF